MDRIKDSGSFGPGSNPGRVTINNRNHLKIKWLRFIFYRRLSILFKMLK